MITLQAPEGYKYFDRKTNKSYSVVVINEKDKDRFELVPDIERR